MDSLLVSVTFASIAPRMVFIGAMPNEFAEQQ